MCNHQVLTNPHQISFIQTWEKVALLRGQVVRLLFNVMAFAICKVPLQTLFQYFTTESFPASLSLHVPLLHSISRHKHVTSVQLNMKCWIAILQTDFPGTYLNAPLMGKYWVPLSHFNWWRNSAFFQKPKSSLSDWMLCFFQMIHVGQEGQVSRLIN